MKEAEMEEVLKWQLKIQDAVNIKNVDDSDAKMRARLKKYIPSKGKLDVNAMEIGNAPLIKIAGQKFKNLRHKEGVQDNVIDMNIAE